MPTQVDLYNNAYATIEHDLYRQVRAETYGQDLGQTSWVTSDESGRIPELLNLSRGSNVLEIGSGSGLYALHLARRIGCFITGLELNPSAIAGARRLASADGLSPLAHFQQCDASQPLPFADVAFDAAFANDVVCHLPGRARFFEEIYRVLRPGARLLFSDALIVGGLISHHELATRSSIGLYFFSPPAENERLLGLAGFRILSVQDTSAQAADIAQRWHNARERHRDQLIALEDTPGDPGRFDGLQRFLSCVHTLTSERRLLRYLYLAEKPEA